MGQAVALELFPGLIVGKRSWVAENDGILMMVGDVTGTALWFSSGRPAVLGAHVQRKALARISRVVEIAAVECQAIMHADTPGGRMAGTTSHSRPSVSRREASMRSISPKKPPRPST